MNAVDRFLQDWRIRRALPWIPDGARVLDVGCADGALFRRLGPHLGEGVGVDPDLESASSSGRFRLLPGAFPEALGATTKAAANGDRYDVVTFLAVLEHVPDDELDTWVEACRALLRTDGRVVATVPSPRVDTLLDVGIRLRLLHGMEAGQHHGSDPGGIVHAFRRAGFDVVESKRFQLGLNNLFVFSN
jgi:SAM-dependent methyltransferase